MRFVAASDASLLIVFGDKISERTTANVVSLFRAIDNASPGWLINLHPAFTSLLVHFDIAQTNHDAVEQFVRGTKPANDADRSLARTIELVVHYDGEDLLDVARHCGLTVDTLIARHTAPTYRVAFLGFQPGFAYLLGLAASLVVPRLDAPRPRVRAGSVAIGGAQTGVYPREGPGGWRIIGHLADARALDETWAAPGDRVRFINASAR